MDCVYELVDKHLEAADLSYACFEKFWAESSVRTIHLTRFYGKQGVWKLRRREWSYVNPMFEYLVEIIVDPKVTLGKAVYSLYTLYVLYYTQITDFKYSVYILPTHFEGMLHFTLHASVMETSDPLAIITKMRNDGCFTYSLYYYRDYELGTLAKNTTLASFVKEVGPSCIPAADLSSRMELDDLNVLGTIYKNAASHIYSEEFASRDQPKFYNSLRDSDVAIAMSSEKYERCFQKLQDEMEAEIRRKRAGGAPLLGKLGLPEYATRTRIERNQESANDRQLDLSNARRLIESAQQLLDDN